MLSNFFIDRPIFATVLSATGSEMRGESMRKKRAGKG